MRILIDTNRLLYFLKLFRKYAGKTIHKVDGIGKKDFFDYYRENEIGYGIVIKAVMKFKAEKYPIEFIENFIVPKVLCLFGEGFKY